MGHSAYNRYGNDLHRLIQRLRRGEPISQDTRRILQSPYHSIDVMADAMSRHITSTIGAIVKILTERVSPVDRALLISYTKQLHGYIPSRPKIIKSTTLDPDTIQRIEELRKKLGWNQSEIIRAGVRLLHAFILAEERSKGEKK